MSAAEPTLNIGRDDFTRSTSRLRMEPDFTCHNDLASEKIGGKVMFVTNEKITKAKNLLKPTEPIWREAVYTDRGQWMDGWSTEKNTDPDGLHFCIIKLGIPGIISGFDIDTLYFSGNYAPQVSVQAAQISSLKHKTEESRLMLAEESEKWPELVAKSHLQPGIRVSRHNYFTVENNTTWTHLRLNIYPEGGIARMRVYGRAKPDWSKIPSVSSQLINLAAMENGCVCLSYSGATVGHPRNLIYPGVAAAETDGWVTTGKQDESSENQNPPSGEWAVFRLAHPGIISMIEIDTRRFHGNYPDTCWIEGCLITDKKEEKTLSENPDNVVWKTLLPLKKLSANFQHTFEQTSDIFSHVRLLISPHGGVGRLRIWGHCLTPGVRKARL